LPLIFLLLTNQSKRQGKPLGLGLPRPRTAGPLLPLIWQKQGKKSKGSRNKKEVGIKVN